MSDLAELMEHLSNAFANFYRQIEERDGDIHELREEVAELGSSVTALSNRIESHCRMCDERITHALDVAAGRDAR